MQYYQSAIIRGIFILPLIALIPLVPYYWKKKQRGVANPFRLLTFYSFILYALICWFFVVLPLPSEEWLAAIQPAKANFLPGSYFRELTEETSFDLMQSSTYTEALISGCALQYWFNILMLLPLGMYLRYIFKQDIRRTAVFSFLTTLLFEITQLTAVFGLFSKPYRSFDIDDLLCNFAGAMLGYLLMGKLMPLAKRIEGLTEQAYRKGESLSIIRRSAALFIDANIVIGFNRLLSLAGMDALVGLRFSSEVFVVQMFLYTVLFSVFFGGATPGKRLLHFSVQHIKGQRACVLSLFVRYTLLYGVLLLYCLLPQMTAALGMTVQASDLLMTLAHAFGLSALIYYTIVVWMFPSRDYPWGTLSKTRAVRKPAAGAVQNK